jgi:hypothetical protein
MTQAIEPEQWAAITQFQRCNRTRDPNSLTFAVADHAITLTLSPERPVDAFLARNAWRDARKTVLRRRRRIQMREAPSLYSEDGLEVCREVQDTCSRSGTGVVDVQQSIIWGEAYGQLHATLKLRNRYAAACLDAWRDGREEHETAAALGISLAYVKKLRSAIRRVATEIFAEDV